MTDAAAPVRIALDATTIVSGLLLTGDAPRAAYVFAHGAGAGMDHAFMTDFARGLAERGIATVRFQFPSMERKSRRPDSPAVAHAAVRAAVDEAAKLLPALPLFAGGKSFGGRMTSQAQAERPLPGVRGLAFVGFPLHAPDKPSIARAAHLADVTVPMLFLQGTRDKLAEWTLIDDVTTELAARATLARIEAADHSFHVLVRSGRTDAQVLVQMLDAFADWVDVILKVDIVN